MTALPVVALHGFMGSPETFSHLKERFPGRMLPVALPEPLAVGGDDSFEDESLTEAGENAGESTGGYPLSNGHDRVAKHLLAYLTQRGMDRFHLLGYSLGGRIAMHMAELAPERVDGLILESAHPGLEDGMEREARRDHDHAWATRFRVEGRGALESWYEQGVFSSLPDELRKTLIREKSNRSWESDADAMEALSLGGQRSQWEALAERIGPTLFISGEMDERYTKVGERLAMLSGQIRHVALEGTGHVVHREQPAAYLAALQSFLSKQSSPNT